MRLGLFFAIEITWKKRPNQPHIVNAFSKYCKVLTKQTKK